MSALDRPKVLVDLVLAAVVFLTTVGIAAVAAAPDASNPAIAPAAIASQARFPEPLIATAQTTPAEDQGLAAALARYDRRDRVDDYSALTDFLKRFPDSPWRMALLLDLGLEYEHYGYYSRALEAFQGAWSEGREATDAYQKPLADRAIGELVLLHARLGHEDRLKALIAEIGDRAVVNPGGEAVQKARETLWIMENEPKHLYLCGPLALKFLMMENPATTSEQLDFITRYRASPKGVSLAELDRLAGDAKVSLTPVFRNADQPVPVPSIVHWKPGHYAAILGREKDGYLVRDPVLGQHARWLPAGAVEEETSGYFLAQAGEVEAAGWRRVDSDEAGQVFGAGPTNSTAPGHTTCPLCKYDIAELSVGVTLIDQPVGYAPAIGPSAKVNIGYSQRQDVQPAVFGFFNVSPNWTINWMRFVQDDPAHLGQSVMRYFGDGDAWFYSGYNSATGSFAAEEGDAAVLTLASTNPVTYRRSLQDGSVEVYSQSDGSTSNPRKVFLTRIVDPQGNALTLNYATSGGHVLLTSLTDATGRKTTFTYGAASPLLITKITDPFGRAATLAYDGSGRLNSITDIIGLTSSFGYDSSGHVQSLTTPYGTTKFAFGGTGNTRFVDVTDPLGLHEREESLQPAPVPKWDPVVPVAMNVFNDFLNYRDSFHWDKHEYAAAACTVNGGCNYNYARNTHFYHDAQDINIEWYQIESLKEPLETRVWYNYPGQTANLNNGTYDQPSQVGRIVSGGLSQIWNRNYNAAGNPTQTVDPVGRTTNLTYAANLTDLTQVAQATVSGAQTTASYTYNSQHRPLTYTDAAGQLTRYAYNAAGQVTQAILPTGLVWKFAYDSLGRLTGIINPNGRSQASYTYDSFDRVGTATDSEGYTLAYTYDAADRVTQIAYPDGTKRTFTYNRLDLASVTDRQGRTTKYSYDANRQMIATTDPLGNVTRYAYWENGQLKSLTDPKGNVTTWAIDVQGRPTGKQYADGSKLAYSYDQSGRLASVRDALGQIKLFGYTVDDRLASVGYVHAVNPTAGASFAYDPYFPRLASMTDQTGATTYAYVPAGSPGALQLQSETGPQGTIAYAYDALGRTTGRTVSGSAETFTYDALNRLVAHTDPLGNFALRYLGQTNQIASRTQTAAAFYPDSTVWSYLANAGDRRLASIANAGMRTFAFTTTPEDLITKIVDSGSNTWAYAYDSDNRLTNASTLAGLQYGVTLDANGNMTALKQSAATTTFSYNTLNELTGTKTISPVTYAYDANGNQVSDGLRTFQYDAENRLIGIAYVGTNASTKFVYDGLGRRVATTELLSATTSTTTHYQWCGAQICRSIGSGGTLRNYYDEGEALPTTGQLLYYGPDQLGTARNYALFNTATKAASVKALDFDPFGNALTNPAAPLPDFGFAGMLHHAPSGLSLTLYRAYAPAIGRWLSRDPLGELGEQDSDDGILSAATLDQAPENLLDFPDADTLSALPFTRPGNAAAAPDVPDLASGDPAASDRSNLYAYVSGDFVNLVDPLGLCKGKKKPGNKPKPQPKPKPKPQPKPPESNRPWWWPNIHGELHGGGSWGGPTFGGGGHVTF